MSDKNLDKDNDEVEDIEINLDEEVDDSDDENIDNLEQSSHNNTLTSHKPEHEENPKGLHWSIKLILITLLLISFFTLGFWGTVGFGIVLLVVMLIAAS